MTDPITGRQFRLLDYLPLLAILGAGIGVYARMETRDASMDLRLAALTSSLADRIRTADVRETDQESRLRALETQQTRSDERFNAILERIDAQGAVLERIEERLAGGRP